MLFKLLVLSIIIGFLSILFPVSLAVTTPLFVIFALAWAVAAFKFGGKRYAATAGARVAQPKAASAATASNEVQYVGVGVDLAEKAGVTEDCAGGTSSTVTAGSNGDNVEALARMGASPTALLMDGARRKVNGENGAGGHAVDLTLKASDAYMEYHPEGRVVKAAAKNVLRLVLALGLLWSAYLWYTDVRAWWVWIVWVSVTFMLAQYWDSLVGERRKRMAREAGRPWLGKNFDSGIFIGSGLAAWAGYGFYLPFVRDWPEIIEFPMWGVMGLLLLVALVAVRPSPTKDDSTASYSSENGS